VQRKCRPPRPPRVPLCFTRARRGRKWKNAVAFASVGGTAAVFEAQHLYEQWPKLDVDRKRAIVESIFEKVEIGEGKINITYSGLPSSEELCKSQQQMAPATC